MNRRITEYDLWENDAVMALNATLGLKMHDLVVLANVLNQQFNINTKTKDVWMQVVDDALVCAHLGVANPDDSYDVAKKKLSDLIWWSVQVDRDIGREE